MSCSDNHIDVEAIDFGIGSLNHGFVYPAAQWLSFVMPKFSGATRVRVLDV